MIALFISLAAASGSATVEADAANLAFTQCLFATSRAASAAGLSPGAFEQRLASACIAEQRALGANVDEVAKAARRDVVDAYRKAIELEPQMRQIGEMCRAHPEQCRN